MTGMEIAHRRHQPDDRAFVSPRAHARAQLIYAFDYLHAGILQPSLARRLENVLGSRETSVFDGGDIRADGLGDIALIGQEIARKFWRFARRDAEHVLQ